MPKFIHNCSGKKPLSLQVKGEEHSCCRASLSSPHVLVHPAAQLPHSGRLHEGGMEILGIERMLVAEGVPTISNEDPAESVDQLGAHSHGAPLSPLHSTGPRQ